MEKETIFTNKKNGKVGKIEYDLILDLRTQIKKAENEGN